MIVVALERPSTLAPSNASLKLDNYKIYLPLLVDSIFDAGEGRYVYLNIKKVPNIKYRVQTQREQG